MSGPSLAPQAAQQRIHDHKEVVAVQALLDLPNAATGNNNEGQMSTSDNITDNVNATSASVKSSSNSETLDSNLNAGTPVNQLLQSSAEINNTNTEDSNNSSSSRDSDDLPLSQLKQEIDDENLTLAEIKENEEENLPLSELKDRLSRDKPYFKTKLYELYKYKRKRIFKCIKCGQTERSQKDINKHFKDSHGYLLCDKYDKQFVTISAMCKHA